MNQNQPFVLTRSGYEALQQELADYQQQLEEHMEDVENFQDAVDKQFSATGAEFEVQTKREFLNERIGNLQLILRDAEVIDEDPNPRRVDPGDRVTLWNTKDEEELQYDLIGGAEAQYGFEGVSIDSPVGSALLGKQIGDVVEVETPDGRVRYMVRDIEPTPDEN